jgi:hypothetical protein
VSRIESALKWAETSGSALLGTSVVVQSTRDRLAFTYRPQHDLKVHVHISDAPVASGHRWGEDVMRGLALHEFGHHLYDYRARGMRTMAGIARSEGLQEIFDYLLDARLERRLQSSYPQWAPYLDRLNAYAFHHAPVRLPLEAYGLFLELEPEGVALRVERGELPGQLVHQGDGPSAVELRSSEIFELPGAVPRLQAFLSCLVAGFDPSRHPDPRVAEAMAEVPRNLKDLSHAELLEVARQVGSVLGRSDEFRREHRRWRRSVMRLAHALRSLLEWMQRQSELTSAPPWMDGAKLPLGIPGRQRGRRATPRAWPQGARPGRRIGGHRKPPAKELPKALGFSELPKREALPNDAAAHAQLVMPIRPHVRRLRTYFERLGTRFDEERPVRTGKRLDVARARTLAFRPTFSLMIRQRQIVQPDAYIGIVIDRSASMTGSKIETAKTFGALLVEAARGIRGLRGNVGAFDDDTWFDLGDFQRCSVAALAAGGGNNDAGGLYYAAALARASGKRNRLLVMISDGQPTACSFESLEHLVTHLTTREDFVCVQVAVESLEVSAFPHHVDLSAYGTQEAATRFSQLLMRLTSGWR